MRRNIGPAAAGPAATALLSQKSIISIKSYPQKNLTLHNKSTFDNKWK